MKKNTIILLIGAALGIFAYRYFLKGGTGNISASKVMAGPGTNLERTNVQATYIGPDFMYTGLTRKTGDKISGTLNEDGSLNYTMSGNGIVASSKVFVIPQSQYVAVIQ